MRYKKIILVAGTRPNFVKAAPLLKAFKALPQSRRPRVWLLHTGQHYDQQLSQVFFQDLRIPQPDIFLEIKPQRASGQTEEILKKLPRIFAAIKPDLVMVVGDVTSTVACALAARLAGIPVAHVEAGLRSYDQSMPEELNRVLTDHLSEHLFTSCPEARGNLLKEGSARRKIFFAGNVMIDTLKAELPKAESRKVLRQLGLRQGKAVRPYVLLTLHRPGNVDDPKTLGPIIKAFQKIAREVTVVFPAHPRTINKLKTESSKLKVESIKLKAGSRKLKAGKGLMIVPPLGYLDFIALQQNALAVFTDSGGVQEETSFLGVPCFTVRPNTERPVTVRLGTNRVIGTKPGAIIQAWRKFKIQNSKFKIQKRRTLNSKRKTGIPRWDGHAAERIVKALTTES